MKLRCLGSGSSGNCYLLENETECLILDCGIPIKEIKKALDFNVSKIVAVFSSHVHSDHFLSIKDFKKMGIPTFTPFEGVKQSIQFGNFKLHAFPLKHDDVENRGVLVMHPEMKPLLYMTDMEFCSFTFRDFKVGTMLIESNYSKEYISDDVSKRNHVLRGHCEIDTTLGIIEANKTDSLERVILCHLSRKSAEPMEFKVKAEKVTKCQVYVAEKGLEVELRNKDLCPFM